MNILNKTKEAVTKINQIKVQSPQEKIILKLLNIILIIALIVVVVNTVDSICVKKYHKGPFFAIPLKTYNDGGTKEYYGLGYKVIKYKQTQGRRDTVMGSWFMDYSINTINVEPIDLALEFRNSPNSAYNKYKGHLLKIEGKLDSVNLDKNQVILKYVDSSKKYSLDIICNLVDKEDAINYIVGNDVIVLGAVDSFSVQTKDKVNTLVIKDAFVQ